MKLNLKNITLVSVDGLNAKGALNVLEYCSQEINFGAIKLFTPTPISHDTIEIFKTDTINSTELYSEFIIKNLVDYISTDYMLIVQTDGYIANPGAWEEEFMAYDYIGAPWHEGTCTIGGFQAVGIHNNVGNGGFSIRSRELMKKVKELALIEQKFEIHPEDVYICRGIRLDLLRFGFTFAPAGLASRFSLENNHLDDKYNNQFGWHGWRTRKNNPELDCIS